MLTKKLQPRLVPLGDMALLVRFGDVLAEEANAAAIAFARRLEKEAIPGVLEIVPNLISVLLRYDATVLSFDKLAGELRLRLFTFEPDVPPSAAQTVEVQFDGPDIGEVSDTLGLTIETFVQAHNASSLHVLSTGFAPGFVYCGLHPPALVVPRRTEVRASVRAGSILFAAGQTAITATEMPTGWHVIGHTSFINFNPLSEPPTRLAAGDRIRFKAVP